MNLIRKEIIALLLVALLFGGFGNVAHAVGMPQKTEATSKSYIVQLKSPVGEVLMVLGSNVRPRFTFAETPDLAYVYTFTSVKSLSELRALLAPELVYIEENKTLRTEALTVTPLLTTNDPGYTSNSLDVDRQWGLPKAEFLDAWNISKGSKDVVVAVIDTGIDASHEDLINTSITTGYNFITRKKIERLANSDDNGHGTIVAGIISAEPNNRKGVVGAAWEATLMPVKALDASGSGNAADIAESIVWAADNGANVINMSIGGIGFGHDTTLANSISHAFEKNVVIIAAAGNDVAITGGDLDVEPVFPICDDNGQNMVIGVAASDHNDLKPAFSNFGVSCVDVIAPGKRILSTINHDPLTKAYAPHAYAYASGTSMSVPYVSAQAVLLKARFPGATNKQIRDRIIATAQNVDNLNLSQCAGKSCKGKLGAGRIDVLKSLEQDLITFKDQDLVRIESTGETYLINGGRKQRVIPFVYAQRFSGQSVKSIPSISDLSTFPDGTLAEPLDDTLIKEAGSSTVFSMQKGLKLPITYQVFQLRGLKFSNVSTLSKVEVSAWLTGSFLTPPEGSLVRTSGSQTVYWVTGGVLHPINFGFYQDRGLNVFPVVYISDVDLRGFSKGEAYTK